MKKYPSYKDSGVEWIGEIPSHWKISKSKFYVKLKSGDGFRNELQGRDDGGDYPFFKVSDTNNKGNEKYLINSNNYVTQKEFNEERWTQFNKGTLVFPKIGMGLLLNKRRILNQPSFIDNNMMGLEPNQHLDTEYTYYNYLLVDFKDYCSDGTVPSINESQVGIIPILIPPISEQHQIVSYLDEKTSQIDTLIQSKQRKIKLLKEKRTSLINEVVTKGLNSDVEMKNSGVEWIGEIPSHWEINKMKYLVNLINDKQETSDGDIKISPENVESDTGKCFDLYSDYSGQGVKFKEGDVLLNKLRLYLKKILLTDYSGYSMGEMIVLRTNNKFINKYLFYLLFNQGLIDFLDSQSQGVKLPRVSPDTILNTHLPNPSINEQSQIVEFLDYETHKIDTTIKFEEQKIGLLKEYKKSLISEVVTGKVNVQEEVNEVLV